MIIKLTERQLAIMENLRSKCENEKRLLIDRFMEDELKFDDINELCCVINDEFLMEGILPNYEPNEYGLELEDLLDSVNGLRNIIFNS